MTKWGFYPINSQSKCIGLLGRLFGHKFVDVYDTEEKLPTNLTVHDTPAPWQAEIIRAATSVKTTFVHSYCVRCGLTINETSKHEPTELETPGAEGPENTSGSEAGESAKDPAAKAGQPPA